MRIVNRALARRYAERNASAKKPLALWLKVVAAANWNTPHDVKAALPSADLVRVGEEPLWVFNIRGNNYRLIALVVFAASELTILEIMTHAQYDKWNKNR